MWEIGKEKGGEREKELKKGIKKKRRGGGGED
jgi:hypothetical protein